MKLGTLKTQAQATTFLTQKVGGRQSLSDAQIKGLQLERLAVGHGKWRLRYKTPNGRRACLTIGDAPTLTLADARLRAEEMRRQIAMGIDPADEKRANQLVPTFGEFIEQQYVPHIKNYKRSWKTDISLLKNHLIPRFGNIQMDRITRQDIVTMHADRRNSGGAPGSANRLLIMMRYIFNLASRWEVAGITANPTKNVPLMPEGNMKERYLSEEEARRLYDAVCQSDNPVLKYIFTALILSGARKREVLDARWDDFDFARRIWRIPTTKLGKPRHFPMSDGLMNLLTTMPRNLKSDYVFANPKTNKPFTSIFSAWDTARKAAGLPEVRIHDLRHSFASFLVNSGRSLYEIGKLLGHTQVRTTQRYAHLAPETLLDASNAATRAVGSVVGLMSTRIGDVPLLAAQG